MLKHRVIPALLLQNQGLVKTRKFKSPKYIGDPINAIRIFNDKEVDELIVLDITASKLRVDPDYELIESIASECFMPLCYGGGIRSVSHAAAIFDLGVEKVCLQSAALLDISLVSRIADRFGSQSVVVSVDVSRDWFNRPRLFESRRGRTLSTDWLDFLRLAESAGAGEIALNAVRRDGEMLGVDSDLIQRASAELSIPLTAIGGVGCLEDIKAAIDAGASAVAAGAFFVLHGPHRAVLITYPPYAQLEALLEKST